MIVKQIGSNRTKIALALVACIALLIAVGGWRGEQAGLFIGAIGSIATALGMVLGVSGNDEHKE